MEVLSLCNEIFVGLVDLTAEIVGVVWIKIVLRPPCVLLESVFICWVDDLNRF